MKLRNFILLSIFLLACGGGSSEPEIVINIGIDPASVDFGAVVLGTFKDITVTITNESGATDRLSGRLAISGAGFSIVGTDSFSLGDGQFRPFTVRFTANSEGSFTGTLTATHNATNQSSPATVQLSANGDDRADEINAAIDSGWQLFETQDFAGAEGAFESAIADANLSPLYENLLAEAESGRGWVRAKQRNFSSARSDFQTSLSRQNIETSTELNSKAGLAFVHHALNQFNLAVQRAGQVLNADANYTFEHDGSVYHKSLRLLLAQSYYSLGDFLNAAAQLDILDPDNAPHSADPGELLPVIQALLASI